MRWISFTCNAEAQVGKLTIRHGWQHILPGATILIAAIELERQPVIWFSCSLLMMYGGAFIAVLMLYASIIIRHMRLENAANIKSTMVGFSLFMVACGVHLGGYLNRVFWR